MELKKRGVFFTVTALALIALFSVALITPFTVDRQQSQFVIDNRLHSMNDFIDNLQQDAGKAVFTSGFRATVALVEQVSTSGVYITDVDLGYNELMTNGSYEGIGSFLMTNNTIINWQDKMSEQAQRIGILLNISLTNLNISHQDPWAVHLAGDFEVNLTDQRGLASWQFNFSTEAEIPIEGFEDPVFIVGTANQLLRTVNRSEHINNFTTSRLDEHIEQGYYVNYTGAPSYLMRLEGDLTNSTYGIESLIDKDTLSQVQPVDTDKSNVDHIYFSTSDPTAYAFSNIAGDFRLDNLSFLNRTHIELYNQTNYTI